MRLSQIDASRIKGIGTVRNNASLAVVVAFALAIAFVDAFRVFAMSGPDLMAHYPADDAFYYLKLAQNFPSPEFTDGITTTGFHPLYWVLLAPLAAIWDGMAGLRSALVFDIVLHSLSGVVLWFVLRHRWSTATAGVVSVAWLVVPYLRELSLMGLETNLSILAVLLVLLAALRAHGRPSVKNMAALGVLSSLAYLSRLDSIFIVVPVLIVFLVANRRLLARSNLAFLIGPAVVVALPWVIYLATHGSLVSTDSARALKILRDHDGLSAGGLGDTFELMYQTANSLVGRVVFTNDIGAWHAVGMLVAVAAIAIFGRRRTQWTPFDAALGVGAVMLFAAYGLILGGTRPWYLAYWVLALFVLVAPVVADFLVSLVSRTPLDTRRAALLASVVAVALGLGALHPNFPQERDKYLAAQAATKIVEKDAVIGSFNAGIYGYFVDQKLVNLDGVVNPDVHSALKNKTLCQYLHDNNVTWFLDEPEAYKSIDRLAPDAQLRDVRSLSKDWSDPVQPQTLARVNTENCKK